MADWTENLYFYYHPVFLEHLKGISHPENPRRLSAIIAYFEEEELWDKLLKKEPVEAAEEWILRNHSQEHIRWVKESCQRAPAYLDAGDTLVTEHSWEAALCAVGAVLDAVDAVMQGQVPAAFCAVRPPGHHAEYNAAMGFCLFNNIAIAARYALEQYHLQRIFIFDWDVHHGNGTQHSFEESDQVFYCSIHQWPLFPGTGRAEERGRGRGEGYTLNVPLPAGKGDADYFQILEQTVLPALREYRPELLMISAGFDAHEGDPLAGMRLSSTAFGEMTRRLASTMKALGTPRIISTLEGGYHLRYLGESVYEHVTNLGLLT